MRCRPTHNPHTVSRTVTLSAPSSTPELPPSRGTALMLSWGTVAQGDEVAKWGGAVQWE